MEEWCGYAANQSQIRQREEQMRRSMLDREVDKSSKGNATAALEIEKRDLRTAALSAMAALCGGPVSITTDSKVLLQFDVIRMLSWIQSIFETPSDRTHAIGRRALTNLILHNREHPYLLDKAIERLVKERIRNYRTWTSASLTRRSRYTSSHSLKHHEGLPSSMPSLLSWSSRNFRTTSKISSLTISATWSPLCFLGCSLSNCKSTPTEDRLLILTCYSSTCSRSPTDQATCYIMRSKHSGKH